MAFDSALKTGNQYLYTGRGPLDARLLVTTYEQLLDTATWTESGSIIAYNGMITAVWMDPDVTKNGIYFLHDSTVTNKFKAPAVSDAANWHKLGGINDLPGLSEQIALIKEELETVKGDLEELKDSATVVIEPGEQLPETGISGKLYVVLEDATTYVWYNDTYLPVGDNSDIQTDIQIIHGGSAAN